MSKSWFCSEEGGLDPAIKMAINIAAQMVAANNPALALAIKPVALGVKAEIDGGTDNAAMNTVFKEVVQKLVSEVTDAPTAAKINAVLGMLNIDIPAAKFPVLSNKTLQDVIDSFVSGFTAV